MRHLTIGLFVAVGSCASTNLGAADWLQFGYDARHSGNNSAETTISTSNVASLVRIYSVDVPVGSTLVYLSEVNIGGVTKDLLFSTTTDGRLFAYDAATAAIVWSRTTPPASPPSQGIQSTPAVDPNRQFVYSYGIDGKVHKFKVVDGDEIETQGWPQVATLKPSVEKSSSALTIGTTPNGRNYLYVVNSSYGDGGDYQGHITAIDLSTGSQNVFNANCSDLAIHFLLDGTPDVTDCATKQNGIWGGPGAVYDTDTNRVYVTTGNGRFDANLGGHNWGDSVLALSPDGTGSGLGDPLDSYTPTNYSNLDVYDLDLGSGSLLILPTPAISNVAHLGLQTGKQGMSLLLNLDNLSGQGGPGFVGGELQTVTPFLWAPDSPTTHPATSVNPIDHSTWVFLPDNLSTGMSGYQLVLDSSGTPSLTLRWSLQPAGSRNMATPVIANGVLYVSEAGGSLTALEPYTGSALWTVADAGVSNRGGPIVVNGRLFVVSSTLQAFTLDTLFKSGFED
ncbi:MAG: PQQ-binding-like beta-propeller repeat protein [Dokdonella sp.]